MLGVSRAGGTGKPRRRRRRERRGKEGRKGGAGKVKYFWWGFLSPGVNHREKYVSVYSIIHSVSYCGPDTLRMHVSLRFEVLFVCFFFLLLDLSESLQNGCVYLFPASVALNTCVSEMRLIKFDEVKKNIYK